MFMAPRFCSDAATMPANEAASPSFWKLTGLRVRHRLAAMVAAALIVMAAVSLPHMAQADDTDTLTIVSGDTRHVFSVELVDTPESRGRGLMYRRSMPDDHGMLFDFDRVEMVSMWMRNTYIPLDMLFIRADGSIARIARDTEPLSERQISSGEPVLSVFEINAGISDRLGIAAGDIVEHPLFNNSQ